MKAARNEAPTAKGFICTKCNGRHEFGLYVAAHSFMQLIHTCECGAKHTIHHYHVARIGRLRKGENRMAEKYEQS